MFIYKGTKYYITTTRFNESTYKENQKYRSISDLTGVVYGTPLLIANTVLHDSKCIVIEMLNYDKKHPKYPGKIMGVSIIKNRVTDRRFKIYKDQNYNRYTYTGNKYVSRDILERHYEDLLRSLENTVFRGKGHLKRAQGITKVPMSFLQKHNNIGPILMNILETHFPLQLHIQMENKQKHIEKNNGNKMQLDNEPKKNNTIKLIQIPDLKI